MLRPHEMSRIIIIGAIDKLEKTIDILFNANAFHIDDFIEDPEKQKGFKIGKPLK